jgi:hypothetical protein
MGFTFVRTYFLRCIIYVYRVAFSVLFSPSFFRSLSLSSSLPYFSIPPSLYLYLSSGYALDVLDGHGLGAFLRLRTTI